MAAAAQNAIVAATNPGVWVRDVENPDQALISFEAYIRQFRRFMNISGLRDLDVGQKWDLLVCMGGSQMEDLVVYRAKVITESIPGVTAVIGVAADPTNGIEAVQAVPGVDAVEATPWEEGINRCRDSISRYSNQIMARNKLFMKMPASNYPDLRKWSLKLELH